MQNISVEELTKAVGGQLYCGNELITFNSVCIDSRKAINNCMYVALVGKRSNGHDFVVNSLNNGASVALVESTENIKLDEIKDSNKAVIKVTNTLVAMQVLALYYRNKFLLPIIAVTGSVGKTTTKEMCYCVLSGKYNTVKNYGNLNSDIGMPLSVFEIDKQHEAAVFEMGMSNKGEILLMSKIAKPYISIITNIGISHIEQLKTKENILKAKLEVEIGMEADGNMILNGDDKMLAPLKGKLVHNVFLYSVENENCDFYAKNIVKYRDKTQFTVATPYGEFDITLNAIGTHNISNSIAAIAAGVCAGLSKEEIQNGILEYGKDNLRQKILNVDGIIIIDDTYNAAPDSMMAALGILKDTVAKRKIAVLSDMLELGEKTTSAHIKIGKKAAEISDIVLCYGENSKLYVSDKSRHTTHFADIKECTKALTNIAKQGDAILFKGSRSMKVEECLEMFIKERKK